MTTKIVIVKFTNAWQGYAAGETAGFDEDKAKALEEAGFATIEKKAASNEKKPSSNDKKNPPKAAQGGAANSNANNIAPEDIPGANGNPDAPGGAGKTEEGVVPGDPNANVDGDPDDKKP